MDDKKIKTYKIGNSTFATFSLLDGTYLHQNVTNGILLSYYQEKIDDNTYGNRIVFMFNPDGEKNITVEIVTNSSIIAIAELFNNLETSHTEYEN